MPTKRINSILFALIGLLALALFFFLVNHSKLNKIFRSKVPKQDIIKKAETYLDSSPIRQYDLRRKISIDIHNDLISFVQTHAEKDSLLKSIPVYTWDVKWSGKIKDSEEGDEISYSLMFDDQGNLVGFEKDFPKPDIQKNLSEEDALELARGFLIESDIDTGNIKLTSKKADRQKEQTEFNFTFADSIKLLQIKENITVSVVGTEITNFSREFTLNEEKDKQAKFEQVTEIVLLVITLVSWLIIIIILITIFFKKFRHDELEFKRALKLAILGFIVIGVAGFLQNLPLEANVLLGLGFGALFVGLGILFVYPVAESLYRDIYPSKLQTIDLLFKGRFQFKELGTAFLNSIFIMGLTLGLFGILIWITSNLSFGSIHLNKDYAYVLLNPLSVLGSIIENITGTLYTGFILMAFFLAFLQSKLSRRSVGAEKKSTLILSLTLTLNLCGLYSVYLKPELLSFILVFPVAALWAYLLVKHDLFTMLISLFGSLTCINFILLPYVEGNFLSTPGIIFLAFLAAFFIIGIFFSSSQKSAKDYEDYVPEYVSRIAERERFLKELEIARNIQMKFLPQSIPEIPNLEIASICKPAMEIGGDYFDFVKTGDGSLGVIIGDVSGKGVSAAFYMTMAKGIIRTLTKKIQLPKQLLTEVNEIFYENVPRNVFISVIYGYLDMEQRILTFARAGHNPLIVHKRGSGLPEMLNPEGLAIGLEKGEIFSRIIKEETIKIEPQDLFVFFTDGVPEARNKNEQEFGEERLSKIIEENADLSAHDLLKKIVDGVNAFTGNTSQFDDFTMVIVKVGS